MRAFCLHLSLRYQLYLQWNRAMTFVSQSMWRRDRCDNRWMRSRAVSHLGGEELQSDSYSYMHSIKGGVRFVRCLKGHDLRAVEVVLLFIHLTGDKRYLGG